MQGKNWRRIKLSQSGYNETYLLLSTNCYMLMNYLNPVLQSLYAILSENKFLVWMGYQYELCDILNSVIR